MNDDNSSTREFQSTSNSCQLGTRTLAEIHHYWEMQYPKTTTDGNHFLIYHETDLIAIVIIEDDILGCAPAVLKQQMTNLLHKQIRLADIQREFGGLIESILGEEDLAYVDRNVFQSSEQFQAERLSLRERDEFLKRLPIGDQNESGLADLSLSDPMFGIKDDEQEVVAMAGYEIWGDDIAHMCIAVDPKSRMHGYAKSVASRTIAHALDADLVVQWRSAPDNFASKSLGQRLGAVRLGTQIGIRLNSSSASSGKDT